jgi:hypothetical protein
MKKRIHLLFALTLLVATTATAQKKFSEGTIVYEVEANREELGMMGQMIPKEVTMKIKNDWVRTEMESSMVSNITLFNNKEKKMTNMMDIMGAKYAIEMNENEMKEQMEKTPAFEIKLSDETKEIAGYKCKKATIINKDTKDESVIYYTESISNFKNDGMTSGIAGLSEIKGLPMEYSMSMQGIEMKMRVKSVTQEKISDELFKVSPEYKKTTMEEFQKEMSGQ